MMNMIKIVLIVLKVNLISYTSFALAGDTQSKLSRIRHP